MREYPLTYTQSRVPDEYERVYIRVCIRAPARKRTAGVRTHVYKYAYTDPFKHFVISAANSTLQQRRWSRAYIYSWIFGRGIYEYIYVRAPYVREFV